MSRKSSLLVLAAGMGLTLAGAVPLVASEPPAPAPAAVDPRGAVLTFDGKLGPNDPKYRKGFQAFRLRFWRGDWAGTSIQMGSAWGDSQGKDFWGWGGGSPAEWSPVLHDDRGHYFVLHLDTAGNSQQVIALFRYRLKDGTFGVAAALLPFRGESKTNQGRAARGKPAAARGTPAIDRRGVALAFDGKLGPHDSGYRKDFEAFRLRFGPGDWAGTSIQVVSAWGDSQGKDLWGWGDGSPAEWSPTLRDDRGDYVILYLHRAGSSHRVIAGMRYLLRDGTFGVAASSFPFHGDASTGTGMMASTTPAPGAKLEVGLEKDLARSRLSVIPAGAAGETRAVVALTKPASPADVGDEGGRFQPILARELIRQAVLIAARDELGLGTRDEVLGDLAPERPGPPVAEVASVFRIQAGAGRVFVRRGEGAGAPALVSRDLPGSAGDFGYLPKLGVLAEALSRNELPAALKAIGLGGTPNPARPGAALPAKVDERLRQLGFVDVLTAVRDLHKAMRADGESEMRLGALARGYAQLGVLSEFQWHPAHKAFKARALLYAQRLLAREATSPWGLWNRAFVLAMVGLPRDARADLDEARKQADSHTPRTAPPDWVNVIDAYIARDPDRLRLEDGPHRKLAALLRMLVYEYPTWTGAALRSARDVVALDPQCYRAHEQMCQVGGVANLHLATALGPEALSQLLPKELDALPSLPNGVRQALARSGDEPALLDALDRAGRPGGDDGEPSWGVLAHLVRETRFVQVYRRLDFLRFHLAVPAEDFWESARPEVAGHRYHRFLETFAQAPRDAARSLTALLNELDTTELECTSVPLLKVIISRDAARGTRAWMSTMSHCDAVVRDVSQLIEAAPTTAEVLKHARALLEIDPRSAFAMLELVYFDWNANKDRVSAWLKLVGEAPPLLWALGKKSSDLKRYDDAAGYLRRFIRQSPDAAAFELLAATYKAVGDRKRWKETLDEFLDTVEDHGLDHARVRVQIANDFMEHQQWAEAQPYADAAAESWAQWAMLCAARCHEGLKDWGAAELWTRRAAERYPNSTWSDWYRVCKRTGHGDIESARARAEAHLEAARGRPDLADPRTAAYFYWSTGALAKARDAMTQAAARDPLDSSLLLALALLADKLGDTARREEAFESLWSKHRGQAPRANQLCRVLRRWLAGGGKGEPDLVSVNATIERSNPERRGELEFFVGRLLMDHGKDELGRPYLTRVSGSAGANDWLRIIAADAIRPPGDARGR
jgi:tetratricopeptide (TPR) repeat protein